MDEEKDERENLLTSTAAAIHIIKANLAVGIMAIPIGFKYSGIAVGVIGKNLE